MNDKLKNKKVVFIDLDSTLIETISGKPCAPYIADCKPIWKTWNNLKSWVGDSKELCYILIVSNQGGIETGKGSNEKYMRIKFNFLSAALQEYIDKSENKVVVDFIYCSSNDKTNPLRKPGTGMFSLIQGRHNLDDVPKERMIMIGDASGRPGDFSDSDLKAAQGYGIDYLDIDDL